MKILITAGGTSEKIDNVRKITNSSSGLLGSIIADTICGKVKNIEKIYYICPKKAIKPAKSDKIQEVTISSTQDVYDNLKEILTKDKVDVVIHSMAVSDYTLQYVTTSEILSNALKNKNEKEIDEILSSKEVAIDNSEKVSSNKSDLILKLVPTPKIIAEIKKWSPSSLLFGFKLLSNTTEENLLDVGYNLLKKNNCDYVIANDISSIRDKTHIAYFIDKNRKVEKVNDKTEIAEKICDILERI